MKRTIIPLLFICLGIGIIYGAGIDLDERIHEMDVVKEGDLLRVIAEFEVRADREKVWYVLTHPEIYLDMYNSYKDVRIEPVDTDVMRVHYVYRIFFNTIKATVLQINVPDEHSLTWSYEGGDLKESLGSYRLEAIPSGTLCRYSSVIEFSSSFLNLFKNLFIKSFTRDTLRTFIEYVEETDIEY